MSDNDPEACATTPAGLCKYCQRPNDDTCLRCIFGIWTDGTKCKEIPAYSPTAAVADQPTKEIIYFVKENTGASAISNVKERIGSTDNKELISTPDDTLNDDFKPLDHI